MEDLPSTDMPGHLDGIDPSAAARRFRFKLWLESRVVIGVLLSPRPLDCLVAGMPGFMQDCKVLHPNSAGRRRPELGLAAQDVGVRDSDQIWLRRCHETSL